MRRRFVLVTAIAWICMAGGALASPRDEQTHGKISSSQRQMIATCKAFYHAWAGDEIGKSHERAKVLLDKLSRAELQKRLAGLLTKTRQGSDAHTSIAYTLAYYGIDAVKNVGQMIHCADSHTTETVAQMDARTDAWLNLPGGLDAIYRRWKEAAVLNTILGLPTDGHLSEEMADVRMYLFLDYPAVVLRAAHGKKVYLDNLAEAIGYNLIDLGTDKDTVRVRKTLQKMSHSNEPIVAHTAQYCRNYVRDYVKRNTQSSEE